MGGAVVLVLLRQIPLAILAVLGLVVYAFVTSARQQAEASLDELPQDENTMIRPLRKLHADLEEFVKQNDGMTSVKVIGAQALSESRQLLDRAEGLIRTRSRLRDMLRRKSQTEMEMAKLEMKLSGAATPEERQALQSAVDAHRSEVAQYATVEASIGQIDSRLRQAEAALSELNARFAVGIAGAQADGSQASELGEIVSRLESLGKSFDEAEQMFQEDRS